MLPSTLQHGYMKKALLREQTTGLFTKARRAMDESQTIEYAERLKQWVDTHDTLLAWLGFSSVAMFFGTILVLGVVIVLLPENYFVKNHRISRRKPIENPVAWVLYLVFKNILGTIFIVAGFIMLFLPGQGILSMIIGLSLTSFPGKRRLIRFLVGRRTVLKSANWLRRKYNRPPLEAPAFRAK
jgi:hypothetical protein